MQMTPVILCGGRGTRLWPLSREQFPKQYQTLYGDKSLFQHTVARAIHITQQAPLIICNQEHRFIVAEQLREIDCLDAQILLEPIGRNTAPAIIMAALYQQSYSRVLWVMPADHYLADDPALTHAMRIAKQQAEAGHLVTLGIKPRRAETAYGYIKLGTTLSTDAYTIDAFIEKPAQDLAEKLSQDNRYLWNSGMFVFTPEVLMQEAALYANDMLASCIALQSGIHKEKDFIWLPPTFSNVPSNSLDYAIMEKTQKACVVPLLSHWHDVGSWDALSQVIGTNNDNNCFIGDVLAKETTNTAIYAHHRLVTAIGLQNQIIVETPDAVLVVNKDHAQSVKELVAELSANARSEVLHHKRVYRPWGWYESITQSNGFQVKHIMVHPQAKLSLQSHQHRAEHWVVVQGQAQITCDENLFILSRNQSTYIPAGSKHRLENLTDQPLELIEVQSGDYLGEDDIVRFEDHYGRI